MKIIKSHAIDKSKLLKIIVRIPLRIKVLSLRVYQILFLI